MSIWSTNSIFPSIFPMSVKGYTIKFKSLKDSDVFSVTVQHGFTKHDMAFQLWC